ncbi:peptidase inhibitor family I36 protein [Streptomyces sp. NPDC005492]|uniref:peptidase inhibitor family I36 protein n=1 Tax=Streptomyces sp. NPDC005492 TaxID=3156883 RepID=UPI0033AAFBDC
MPALRGTGMTKFAVASAFALAVAAGAGTTAHAATDSAAAPAAQTQYCPYQTGYACFWVDNYKGGTMGKVAGNNTNYMNLTNSSGCTKYPGTWNDCISSLENQGTQCTVYFWSAAGYTGNWHSVARYDSVYDFGVDYGDAAFNDTISSNHWCTAS